MKKVILIIGICSLIFSSCFGTRERDSSNQVVSIYGKISGQREAIGMGVMLDNTTLLTSAHVVSDDRISYIVQQGKEYIPISLMERDETRDTAIMKIGDEKTKVNTELETLLKTKNSQKNGDPIYTIVSRSGSLQRLRGKILELNGQTLGYTSGGQTYMLSGVVLTDLMVLTGDSGAPVFTQGGELIDVVHVAGK